MARRTPVPNLILAGAWTRPGHGQTTVMHSGVNTAGMILEAE